MKALSRRVLAGLAVGVASLALAGVASAAIGPVTIKLTQSNTTAGSTQPLGMDLTFAPSGGDSVKDLTLALPPGLLADASIDGGKCLRTSKPIAACQVGSGTVTATENVLLPVPLTLPATFVLVRPPHGHDLAGLALLVTNPLTGPAQLGSAGEITVRHSKDRAGVGVNIAFAKIPNTFPVALGISVPISVDNIHSTFAGLRLPTSCPSTPAPLSVTADSYNDPTPLTASAPVHVTGCSKLPYAPVLGVSAVKDKSDSGVQVVTDVTQTADQATSRTVALTLPPKVLQPNLAAVLQAGLVCTTPVLAKCKTIGSASATSPLYPTPLIGKDYLTATFAGIAVTIAFPSPFALTLNGAANLGNNTTTFNNVPDIPLTDLKVSLNGGPAAVYATTCATPSGNAIGKFTAQDGSPTVSSSAHFTVSGC